MPIFDLENSEESRRKKIQDELDEYRDSVDSSKTNSQNATQGPTSFLPKNARGSVRGISSIDPIPISITKNNTPGGEFSTVGTSVIVDDPIALTNVDLYWVDDALHDGQWFYARPKAGKSLTLKIGGNFNILSDVIITDKDIALFVFYKDHNKWNIAISSANSGTEVFTWTAPHSGDGHGLIELGPLGFKNAAGATGIQVNGFGGIDVESPTIDIAFFVNRPGNPIPQMEIQENGIFFSKITNHQGNEIFNFNRLRFTDPDEYIQNSADGLEYIIDENTGDGHHFFVGTGIGSKKLEIGLSVIEIFEDIRINNENINEIRGLFFNQGQSIQGGSAEYAFLSNVNEPETHYNGVVKILEIDQDGLTMQSGKIIDYGPNISLSANSGFISLPGNPVGFINVKVNGGNARIPYYAV